MRLRRKQATGPGTEPGEQAEGLEGSGDSEGPDGGVALTDGPHDADAVDASDNPVFADHVDLGGLLIGEPPAGSDIRLTVDEESGTVLAVMLAGEEGAVELRAFAARRDADMWAEVRPAIAEETEKIGGSAAEQEGPFGTELACVIPVTAPDGSPAQQPSRVIGVNGPRWFLRATLLGLPAIEPENAGEWEAAIRRVVVRRGQLAMPPGEALELHLPPDAQRMA